MPAPEASIPNDARSTDPLLPAIRAHEQAIALRAEGRFPPPSAPAVRASRAIARSRGPPPPRRRQRAGRARPRPGGARSPARRGPLPAPALRILLLDRSRDPDIARLIIRARTALAGIDRTLGAYAAADRGYRTALVEIRRRFGPRDRYLAGVLNDLGVLRKAQGRYDEALAFYRRALPLVPRGDRTRSRRWPTTWAASSTPAATTDAPSRTHAAPCGCGPRWSAASHPSVAADVAALAAIVEARGRLGEAAKLYGRALAVFGQVLGPTSLEVGLNLARLAAVEQRRRRPGARP